MKISADEVLKKAELRGMNYYFFCTDKARQKYEIDFESNYNEKDVTIQLNALDEMGGTEPVHLRACSVNGKPVQPENDELIRVSLKNGEMVRIEFETDQDEMFSGEVKVYAYRK